MGARRGDLHAFVKQRVGGLVQAAYLIVSARSETDLSDLFMRESFLVLDTGRNDHVGKGIIDIYGGIKWGRQIAPAQS